MFEDNLRKLRERLQQEQEQVGTFKLERTAAGHEQERCISTVRSCSTNACSRSSEPRFLNLADFTAGSLATGSCG